MQRYFTCSPDALLIGQTAVALLVNLQYDEIKPILVKYGLNEIDPNQWYPVQRILDIFNDIERIPGGMMDLVAIGIAAGELGVKNMPEPLRKLPFDQFIEAYSQIWITRHKNIDPKAVQTIVAGPKHVIITSMGPYPDDVIYGIFYAYARAILPKGTKFTVKYDEEKKRYDNGGETTYIHIIWE